MKRLSETIKNLLEIPSISGYEYDFTSLIKKNIQNYVDEMYIDKLGNLIALKKGYGEKKLKLLFDTHIDQIGLIITKIEKNGILRFNRIGGIYKQSLYGKRVKIFGKKTLYGIIGMKPPHLMSPEEVKKADNFEELFIDTGISDEKEVKKYINIGDIALLDFTPADLLSNHYSGAGLDDKAGVLALIETIKLLKTYKNYHDVYFLFATQEEVGLRGAKVGAFSVMPDVAIAVDVTAADPIIYDQTNLKTSKGPAIGIGPNFSGKLTKKIQELAETEDIPVQIEIEPRPGGTDAYYLQITGNSVFTALISIPLRYMHTQVEIINLKDVYRVAKILALISTKEDLLN